MRNPASATNGTTGGFCTTNAEIDAARAIVQAMRAIEPRRLSATPMA
jgi:hypothetical protein